jgi:hypothetical protein
MTPASAARDGDQNDYFLVNESAGSEIMDGCSIQAWQPIEVESFQRLVWLRRLARRMGKLSFLFSLRATSP